MSDPKKPEPPLSNDPELRAFMRSVDRMLQGRIPDQAKPPPDDQPQPQPPPIVVQPTASPPSPKVAPVYDPNPSSFFRAVHDSIPTRPANASPVPSPPTAHPPPRLATEPPALDADLVALIQLWPQLSARDRRELYLLALVKHKLAE